MSEEGLGEGDIPSGCTIMNPPNEGEKINPAISIDEDENEPYTRWQGFRIGQLSLCISLFLTFSLATLGFSANLLIHLASCVTHWFVAALILSGVLGAFSIACGAVACLTRLADFRATAQVARHRCDESRKAEIEEWRKKYKRMGKWTWRLFRGQLLTFALQAIVLVLSLGITYWPE